MLKHVGNVGKVGYSHRQRHKSCFFSFEQFYYSKFRVSSPAHHYPNKHIHMSKNTLAIFSSTFNCSPVRNPVETRGLEKMFTNQTFFKVNSKLLFFFTFFSIHLPPLSTGHKMICC
jgi:hypothetical protein